MKSFKVSEEAVFAIKILITKNTIFNSQSNAQPIVQIILT